MKHLIWLKLIFFILACTVVSANSETDRNKLAANNIPYNQQEFFKYVKKGDVKVVNLFFEAGIDINCKNTDGATPLIVASEEGKNHIIKLLLSKGADVNAQDIGGWTALIMAANGGYVDTVQILIKHGSELNKNTRWNVTALMKACENGFYEVVKILLDAGADMGKKDDGGKTALINAVLSGQRNIVELLLAKGANINDRDLRHGYPGETALMFAAWGSEIDVFDVLLANGADVNIRTKDGQTALLKATKSKYNRLEKVKKLIEKGADVYGRDDKGLTALIYAKKKNDAILVKLLLKAGGKESNEMQQPETVKSYKFTVIADEEGYMGKGEYLLDDVQHPGGYVLTIRASSSLKNCKSIKYNSKQAHDYKAFTAWIEGNPDYGIGEYLEYKFDFTNVKKTDYAINKIIVYNGYLKSEALWKANSRVKKLKIYLNNKIHTAITLKDSQEMQIIDIPDILFEAKKVYIIRCQILDVFEGSKYKDTAISELQFAGSFGLRDTLIY
jgi:ankyrin repeat protein